RRHLLVRLALGVENDLFRLVVAEATKPKAAAVDSRRLELAKGKLANRVAERRGVGSQLVEVGGVAVTREELDGVRRKRLAIGLRNVIDAVGRPVVVIH